MNISREKNKERRMYPRVPSAGSARIITIYGTFSGEIRNISLGGMMIKTHDHSEILEDLITNPDLTFFSVKFPPDLNLTTKGAFVRACLSKGSLKTVAVRFLALPDEKKNRLVEYIDSLEKSRGPKAAVLCRTT